MPTKKRLNRYELLGKFFPELGDTKTSKGEKEAAVKISALSCELILADWINFYDQGFNRYGPGVLCIRLHKTSKKSEYLSKSDLEDDLSNAERSNAEDIAKSIREVIESIDSHNTEKAALIMLVDNSRLSVFPLDRDNPAQGIKAMMEEFSA